MLAKDTICAEMAMMLGERNAGHSSIDYPLGGTGAICTALVRAIRKLGGRVMLGAHIDEILVEGELTFGKKRYRQICKQVLCCHGLLREASLVENVKTCLCLHAAALLEARSHLVMKFAMVLLSRPGTLGNRALKTGVSN